jgi:hypothetical protein
MLCGMNRLQSAQAKIVRAMKQRQSLEAVLTEYRNRKPYRINSDAPGNPKLEITEPPPIEISLIAGEVIYQLRSALDHIFFALVEQNYPGGNVPDDIRNTCQFPLCANPPGGPSNRPSVPRTSFGKKIPTCIPDEAFTVIESLQPYNAQHDARRLLGMLRTFSNIDKHRHLNTTVTRIDRRHTIKFQNELTSTVLSPMLEDGAELHEPVHFIDVAELDKSAIEVEDKFIVTVAFDEPDYGPPQTARVEDVIYRLPTFVFRISTLFQKFFALPITVG